METILVIGNIRDSLDAILTIVRGIFNIETVNKEDAFKKIEEHVPDIAIIDHSDDNQLIQEIKQEHPEIPLLLIADRKIARRPDVDMLFRPFTIQEFFESINLIQQLRQLKCQRQPL